MKKLLLFSFVLCMLFSCSKDDATILEKDNSVISDSKLSSRMSSNSENNFFELEFVEKALEIPNLPSASDLMIENVNYVRNNLTMARSIESNVINDKYPCWTCAIKDKIDGKDVLLTPIVNMATDEVSSIMLFTKYENTKNIFTLDVRALELHESISTPINSFSYYYGVKEYFEKVIHKTELDVDDFSVFFMSQCFTSSSTGWCNCSGSGESCADPGTNCSGSCTSMPPDPDEEPPYSGGGPGVGTLSPWIFDWNDPNSNGVNVDWVRGGGSGGSDNPLLDENGNPISQDDYLDLVFELIDYFVNDRNIELTVDEIQAISDYDMAAFIFSVLYVNREQLTNSEIVAYISFINNQPISFLPHFINSSGLSEFLMFNEEFTDLLNDFLIQNPTSQSIDLGQVVCYEMINQGTNVPPAIIIGNLKTLHDLVLAQSSLVFTNQEIFWLATKRAEILNVSDMAEIGDAISLASAQIYTSLGSKNLLDLTLNEVLAYPDSEFRIHHHFTHYNLTDRNVIASSVWFLMMQAEAKDKGNSIPSWLGAIKDVVKDAVDLALYPISQAINAVMIEFGLDLPSSPEEWADLGQCFVEFMIPVIPELLPFIGEVLALRNAIVALADGQYITSTLEFASVLVGFIPVGKVLKWADEITVVVKNAFKLVKPWKDIFTLKAHKSLRTSPKFLHDFAGVRPKHVPSGPMVGKTIKHTFTKHGSHNTKELLIESVNSGRPTSQWLDDVAAEDFIAKHLNQLGQGAVDVPIPSSIANKMGRVFKGGTGEIIRPTHFRLVPSGNGVKTAHPIVEAFEGSMHPIGVFVP